jgi:hypothetical protein
MSDRMEFQSTQKTIQKMLFNNNNFSVLFKYKIEKLSKKIKAAK